MSKQSLAVRALVACVTCVVACNVPPDDASTSSTQLLAATDGATQGPSSTVIRKAEERAVALAAKYPHFAGYYCKNGDLVVSVATSIADIEAQAVASELKGISSSQFLSHA